MDTILESLLEFIEFILNVAFICFTLFSVYFTAVYLITTYLHIAIYPAKIISVIITGLILLAGSSRKHN